MIRLVRCTSGLLLTGRLRRFRCWYVIDEHHLSAHAPQLGMLAPSVGTLVFEVKANCAQVAVGGLFEQRVLYHGHGSLATILERSSDGGGVFLLLEYCCTYFLSILILTVTIFVAFYKPIYYNINIIFHIEI